MADGGAKTERRVGSHLRKRAERAVANRRVFPYLAGVTALIAVSTGIIAHLIDKRDFQTYEDGIWWSIVTLGTVGYGDIVPHTTWGRVLGSIVIIFGVTFISFLVATVTSVFVSADRDELEAVRVTREQHTHELLQGMNDRLAAIEALLAERGRGEPSGRA
jgi:voltage-gated potassium channel